MKKFMMLVALILCLTVLTLILAGCGEKKEAAKEEPAKEETVQEQEIEQPAEEAPVDTTAVEVPAEQPE